MARGDELENFVRAGLAAGRSREELAGALGQAGWAPRETAAAVSSAPGASVSRG